MYTISPRAVLTGSAKRHCSLVGAPLKIGARGRESKYVTCFPTKKTVSACNLRGISRVASALHEVGFVTVTARLVHAEVFTHMEFR